MIFENIQYVSRIMPLLKPSTPPNKSAKPVGKTIPPKKGELMRG
jgi:hypothetical protein